MGLLLIVILILLGAVYWIYRQMKRKSSQKYVSWPSILCLALHLFTFLVQNYEKTHVSHPAAYGLMFFFYLALPTAIIFFIATIRNILNSLLLYQHRTTWPGSEAVWIWTHILLTGVWLWSILAYPMEVLFAGFAFGEGAATGQSIMSIVICLLLVGVSLQVKRILKRHPSTLQ